MKKNAKEKFPKLSAELYSIPLEERNHFLIYAPLRRAAFVSNAATVNFLASLKEGFYDTSIDPDGSLVEFLRRLEILDADDEIQPITRCTGIPEPTALTLFLTTACNLRCAYCYASAGDTPVKNMPLSVAKRGIDFVVDNAARKQRSRVELNFHGGGEPSMNWRTMTDSFAYARARCNDEGLSLVAFSATNGVLNDRQIDWMVANLQGVSVSCDGTPEMHNAHRKTLTGKGSSEHVMRTLRRFDDAGLDYGVRVTVTADQIPNMTDAVDFICSNSRTSRIQIEPAYQMGRWKNAPSAETQGFVAGFRAAQAWARKHGRSIRFSAARAGLMTNHFCAVSQDSFAISPDGNVSSCYEAFAEEGPLTRLFFYGKASDDDRGYEFDMDRLENLRKQSVEYRPYCNHCFARWSCAGDCYYKGLFANGWAEGDFTGTDRCYITRELTIDQILMRIADAVGIFWHEAPPQDDANPERSPAVTEENLRRLT